MQEIKVQQTRADIASIISEARKKQGLSKSKLARQIGQIRSKVVATNQIDRLEGNDGDASYQIDLLLEAAYLLDLEIIIRHKSE